MSDEKPHQLIGRRVVPDWRMPGHGRSAGTALSIAIHGGAILAVAIVLGLPFDTDDPPDPPQVELRLEDPAAEPPQPEERQPQPEPDRTADAETEAAAEDRRQSLDLEHALRRQSTRAQALAAQAVADGAPGIPSKDPEQAMDAAAMPPPALRAETRTRLPAPPQGAPAAEDAAQRQPPAAASDSGPAPAPVQSSEPPSALPRQPDPGASRPTAELSGEAAQDAPPPPAARTVPTMEALASEKRAQAEEDLQAVRAAAARTRQAAAVTDATLRSVASRLEALLERSPSPWARDRIAQSQGAARASAARVENAAEAAAVNAAAAQELAASLQDDTSAAATIRRADAIADARRRAEQVEQEARRNRQQLEQLAILHGSGEPFPSGAGPQAGLADPSADRRPADAAPGEVAPGRGQAELTSADGPPAAAVSAAETGLQRGAAQASAVAWLGDRIRRLVKRQGDAASLPSPDARVALRALEMRSRNLDLAADALIAVLQERQAALRDARQEGRPLPEPDAGQEERIRAANDALVDSARSVAASLDPVIDRLSQDDADWARVMRASFDWLVARRQGETMTGPTPDAPAAPEPNPHQRRVLQAAREADPALPAVTGPRSVPPKQSMQAALNAARLHHIAKAGTPSALYNLANALLSADGVARDPTRAAAIMGGLAEDGYRPAQVRMAEIAMLGDGHRPDPAEALAWYRIAAINGSAAAQKAGAAFAVELTPETRAAAERIVARWLAEQGPLAPPGQDDLDRDLAQAIEQQDYELTERLLKQGANPQALDDRGRTALVGAAWRGRENIVRLLMKHGVTTDLQDAENRSALLWSAINGYPGIADNLLDFGAAVDTRDGSGATPLIRAAWNGKYAVAERLMAAGADVSLRDDEGRTAADRATETGNSRMLRILGGKPGQL